MIGWQTVKRTIQHGESLVEARSHHHLGGHHWRHHRWHHAHRRHKHHGLGRHIAWHLAEVTSHVVEGHRHWGTHRLHRLLNDSPKLISFLLIQVDIKCSYFGQEQFGDRWVINSCIYRLVDVFSNLQQPYLSSNVTIPLRFSSLYFMYGFMLTASTLPNLPNAYLIYCSVASGRIPLTYNCPLWSRSFLEIKLSSFRVLLPYFSNSFILNPCLAASASSWVLKYMIAWPYLTCCSLNSMSIFLTSFPNLLNSFFKMFYISVLLSSVAGIFLRNSLKNYSCLCYLLIYLSSHILVPSTFCSCIFRLDSASSAF